MAKEAQARIKINQMLEKAGWRFFDSREGKANIQLQETNHSLSKEIQEKLVEEF